LLYSEMSLLIQPQQIKIIRKVCQKQKKGDPKKLGT
jgi:hypothetical protein